MVVPSSRRSQLHSAQVGLEKRPLIVSSSLRQEYLQTPLCFCCCLMMVFVAVSLHGTTPDECDDDVANSCPPEVLLAD